MPSEVQVQELVHSMEEGKWKPRIQVLVLLGAIAYVVNLWFFHDAGFRGLGHPMAMDWDVCPYCEAAANAARRASRS